MFDQCNSLYYDLPEWQLNHLQLIQNSLPRAAMRAPKSSYIIPSLRSLHWLKIKERIDYKILFLIYKVIITTKPSSLQILSLLNPIAALVPLMLLTLLVHLYPSIVHLFKSQQPLFPPCLTSSLECFLKNFANLSMMRPCHCQSSHLLSSISSLSQPGTVPDCF